MKFVSWAALGLTVDLRDIDLHQGQWDALLWWHLSFIKETLLLEDVSWHPHLLTQEVQSLYSSTTLLPFPPASLFSLQVPAGLTVVINQVQRAAVISCGRGARGKLAASFL